MSQIKYIGLDLETTGLHPNDGAAILELGMIAFDEKLNEVDTFTSLVYSGKAAFHRENGMPDVVENMHQESGLWEDLEARLDAQGAADIAPEVVQANAIAWFDSLDTDPRYKPFMVGNSVTFDRTFLSSEMPDLLDKFSHRSLDATSICEAAALAGVPRRYLHETAKAKAPTTHRALDDLRAAQRQITVALDAIQRL